MPPITATPDGVLLTIHLQPRASRTEFVGLHGDALKIRVAAPPVEGAANAALCAFLAERFDVPQRAVVIQAGAVSRGKRVLLRGVSAAAVRQAFGVGDA